MAVRALQHLQTSMGQRELKAKLLALTGRESWKMQSLGGAMAAFNESEAYEVC